MNPKIKHSREGAIVTRWLAIVTALIVHYSCIQLVSACLF